MGHNHLIGASNGLGAVHPGSDRERVTQHGTAVYTVTPAGTTTTKVTYGEMQLFGPGGPGTVVLPVALGEDGAFVGGEDVGDVGRPAGEGPVGPWCAR